MSHELIMVSECKSQANQTIDGGHYAIIYDEVVFFIHAVCRINADTAEYDNLGCLDTIPST